MQLYSEIARLTDEGLPFVLATVVDSQGSTPQKPGSKMLVLERGELRGTIGGGAIEKQVIDAALALLENPAAQTQHPGELDVAQAQSSASGRDQGQDEVPCSLSPKNVWRA